MSITTRTHAKRTPTTAIVIGASMAGLVTARALSDHADRVVVLDRDRLPAAAVTRQRVPQSAHTHILLGAGQRLLDGWFPGLTLDLRLQGAVAVPPRDLSWFQGGAHRAPADAGVTLVSMSRPLLETTVRERLLSRCRNVTISDDVAVQGLVVQAGRVTGVRVDGIDHRADLVVDCSGRTTPFLDQLADVGYPSPDVSAIRIQMAYGTRVVRPREGDGPLGALVIDDPTRGHRLGTMLPIEGGRWIVTLAGFHGDAPPTDPEAFAAFARSLPSPELADLLDRSEALTPVLTHGMPTSRRRHVERLDRTPPGFVVLGDAICSFNPVYGQGMSSAALQADALGHAVARHGLRSARLARSFYRRAAKVVDVPWRIAAGADFADPRTTGPKPVGTDLVNRYLARMVLASHASAPVVRKLLLVQNLLAPPATLMTPATMLRVLLASSRSAVVRRPTSVTDIPVPRSAPRSRDKGSAAIDPHHHALALASHPAAGAHPSMIAR